MINLFEQVLGRRARQKGGSLDLGLRVVDGEVTRRHVEISKERRAMHVALLGKSGSGKSSLVRHFSQQDIDAERGFVFFDLHGDATPFLLRTIAARERKVRRHLSDKLVVIAPADPELSVGFNPLEEERPDFVRIAEIAQVLKERWHLDHFGVARMKESGRRLLLYMAQKMARGQEFSARLLSITEQAKKRARQSNLKAPRKN